MSDIALLHTADVHVATFDALLGSHGHISVSHLVRPDLLHRARQDGLDAIRDETRVLQEEMSVADAIICTCSTLGPIADHAAIGQPQIIRIDRPMMEMACEMGRKVAMAICLESTRAATLELFRDCAGGSVVPQVIMCTDARPHFEAGQMDAYAKRISDTIKAQIDHDTDCIIFAQPSMAVASAHLSELGVAVPTSPPLAAKRALGMVAG